MLIFSLFLVSRVIAVDYPVLFGNSICELSFRDHDLYIGCPKFADYSISYNDVASFSFHSPYDKSPSTLNTCSSDTCDSNDENAPSSFNLKISYYPETSSTLSYFLSLIFGASGEKTREHKLITLTVLNTTTTKIQELDHAITQRTNVSSKKRRFLVVINPISGPRKALHHWQSIVQPLTEEANIVSDVILSQYAGYITQVISGEHKDSNSLIKLDLLEYDAIITIGGDGTFSEVLIGILQRPDHWEILEKTPLHPLPSGSGNALSKSILYSRYESSTLINAVFNMIRGKPFSKSLGEVSISKDKTNRYPINSLFPLNQENSDISYSSLAWSYGILADLDIHSDHLRYLGELRFYIYTFYYIGFLKLYAGRLKLKLIDTDYDKYIQENKSITTNEGEDQGRVKEEDRWITIESNKFNYISAVQASHLSETVQFGPGVHLNDDFFTVIYGEDMNRMELLEVVLYADIGAHVNMTKVKVYRCTEYYFEPLLMPWEETSGKREDKIYSLDGEKVDAVPIHGKILPNAANILLLPQP